MDKPFLDVEGAVRSYLMNHPDFLDAKFFFGTPDTIKYPYVTMEQVGGTTNRHVPISSPRISMSVWGGINKKHTASELAQRLCNMFYNLENTKLDNYVFCKDVDVESMIWLPDATDPKNVIARYTVDIIVTVRAV